MVWAKTIIEKEPNISQERKDRWNKLFIPYSELSEEMKEHDRKWARKVLGIMRTEYTLPIRNIRVGFCEHCGDEIDDNGFCYCHR
jgi:hypothetical protein